MYSGTCCPPPAPRPQKDTSHTPTLSNTGGWQPSGLVLPVPLLCRWLNDGHTMPGLLAVRDACRCVCASSSAVVQAGEEDMPVLSPELDHYIQGKDQNECTPLHVAILRGERWWWWWSWW